jgi:hypothetical protein
MMNEDLKERLRKKGWTEQELTHADQIIAKKQELTGKPKINLMIYWTALIVTIIGNIFASFVLIPFLFTVKGIVLFTIIIVLAAIFGFIFTRLLKDIQNMEPQHHVIAGVFIPAIALINVFMMVRVSNILAHQAAMLNIPTTQPLPVAITYVIGFIAPYLISKIKITKKTTTPNTI